MVRSSKTQFETKPVSLWLCASVTARKWFISKTSLMVGIIHFLRIISIYGNLISGNHLSWCTAAALTTVLDTPLVAVAVTQTLLFHGRVWHVQVAFRRTSAKMEECTNLFCSFMTWTWNFAVLIDDWIRTEIELWDYWLIEYLNSCIIHWLIEFALVTFVHLRLLNA